MGRGNRGFETTTNKNTLPTRTYNEFYGRLKKCTEEFNTNTAPGVVRVAVSKAAGIARPRWDTVSSVASGSRGEAHSRYSELRVNLESRLEGEVLSEQEKRKVGGLLHVRQNKMSENPVENK